jgi:hypothetical protein
LYRTGAAIFSHRVSLSLFHGLVSADQVNLLDNENKAAHHLDQLFIFGQLYDQSQKTIE